MHRLFVSDLHLSDDTPDIEAALIALLKNESPFDSLVMLGDIFEAWVGDDDDSPLAERIRLALRALADSGTEILFCRGNRDFMLGEQFASDIGGVLLPDQTVLDVAGHPALLLHGDTLCTDDVDYQQFRELVHSPEWQAEMMTKSLDERRELARQLRSMSIDAASNKPEDIMDVNQSAVSTAMRDADVSVMVHGHTHRPSRHQCDTGERIVLGDWTEQAGWLLRERGSELSLERFSIG
ncbi:MAG: UDP-2,3-diacylglucosamine diphosphatase [Luminiphilus sp.]